jgi:hypothetical protein
MITNKTSRAKFKATAVNRVELTCQFPSEDKPSTIVFYAPLKSGFVVFEGTNTHVRSSFRNKGHAIYWYGNEPLIDVIREDYHALRRKLRYRINKQAKQVKLEQA